MKPYLITKKYRDEKPGPNQIHIAEPAGGKKSANHRKHKITPISQAVMDYYENLLKEHNQYGARHSGLEYRIL